MDYLIHVANVLYLVSYLVKDILWLRLLTIVAGIVLMFFYILRPEPLWAAIYWNVVFTVINVYQVYLLLLERRPVTLSDDEQRLYQLAFRTLTPREFKKLAAVAKWESIEPKTRVVERDRALERMMVIASGALSVEVGERSVATLKEGRLVGEMSFLTGENPNADVVAVEPTRVLSWPKEDLRRFLEKHPDLRGALQMVIGHDLVGKLRTA